MNTLKNLVVFIGGPTGVGKSDLAIKLAKLIQGEVVSCDSVQIYKGLNIGSNKTLQTEGIPHHLIDIANFSSDYSAGHFYLDCIDVIEDIHKRRKIPILVGGTGLYMKWILNGKTTTPEISAKTKYQVKKMLKGFEGWDEALDALKQRDPEYASSLYRNDFYRLERALQITIETGKVLSCFKQKGDFSRNNFQHHLGWDCRCLYLSTDRKYLYRLIDYRCELMLKEGFLEEIVSLKRNGFTSGLSSSNSIGYKEGLDFLDGLQNNESFNVFVEKFADFLYKFQSESRKYVRNQDTWHWKDDRFLWIPRNTPTTTMVSFDDCDPVIYDESICRSIDSLSEFLAEKLTNLSNFEFNNDDLLNCLSAKAKFPKSIRTKDMLKTYCPKLQIFSDLNEIEKIFISLMKSE